MIRRTQCRTREAGGATGYAADVRVERHIDVARLVRPEDPAAGSFQKPDGLGRGMPEPIARADADHGDLRPQHGKHLGGDRATTAVMPDFEHVDIRQRSARSKLRENVALGVARQQNARTVVLDK